MLYSHHSFSNFIMMIKKAKWGESKISLSLLFVILNIEDACFDVLLE